MNRPLLFFGVAVFAAVAGVLTVVAIQLIRSDSVDLLTSAPEIPTAAGARPDPTPTASAAGGGEVFKFVIDGSQSKATYVVREKLAALPISTNAVGETRAISGEIYLTREGLYGDASSLIRVDMSTLRSDEARRDNFIRTNTLQANRFQFAEFVITGIEGFPQSHTEGAEIELKLTGNMTIRGVTKPLTFDVKARQAGDVLTGIADTTFKFQDFGMTPPDVALAKAEENIQLQIEIFARRELS
jgi:polyisoprenoid-binding protein YceI